VFSRERHHKSVADSSRHRGATAAHFIAPLAVIALVAITALQIWHNLGFQIVIFLVGLGAISRELYDAARVDGANERQIGRMFYAADAGSSIAHARRMVTKLIDPKTFVIPDTNRGLGAGSIRFRHGWLLHRLAGVPVGVYVGIAAGGDNGARSVHRRIIVRFGQRGHSPRA